VASVEELSYLCAAMTNHAAAKSQSNPPALDPHLQYAFEAEVLHQWDFVRGALDLMNAALRNQASMDAFWFGLDAALGALANISKIFFPASDRSRTRSQTKRRGCQMREAYGVRDDSLMKERALRDAFEHFDERMDRWFRDSQDHNFLDRNISVPGAITGADPGDYLRHFDPQANVVSVLGDALDLQALVREVEQVVQRVAQQHQTPPHQRPPTTSTP
jgi:hypothetical protein